jgi:hypothetical protein
VVNGVVAAVVQAKQAMRPATLAFDDAELPDMNRSRRDPAFSVDVGGFDANAPLKPDPVKYQTDRRLSLLRATGQDGTPIALLVHFASHPTVLSPDNYLVSADWPGVMNARLEQALGAGAVAMFFNGALGDAAPTPDWSAPAKELADMQQYGEAMAAAVEKRLGSLRPLDQATVAGHTNRADFSRITLRPLGGMPVHHGLAKALYLRPDPPFQALRVGPLVLLATPAEPTTLTGRELETLCRPGFRCLVVGPANDYLGYLVTPEEYAEDTYAADSCFFGAKAVEKIKRALAPSATIVQAAP